MSSISAGSFVRSGDAVLQVHQVLHRTQQLLGYNVKTLRFVVVDAANAVEIEPPESLFGDESDDVLAVNHDKTRAEPAKRLRNEDGDPSESGGEKRIVVRLKMGDRQVVSVPATQVVADVSATPFSKDLLVALVRAGTFSVEEIGRLARVDRYYNRLANLDDVWEYFLERDFPDVYAHYVTVKTGKLVPLISIALDAYTSNPDKRGADRRVYKRFYEFLAKQKTHPDAVLLISQEYSTRVRSVKLATRYQVFQCNESIYVVFQPKYTDTTIRRIAYTANIANTLRDATQISMIGTEVWRSVDTYPVLSSVYAGLSILTFNQDGFVFRPSIPLEGPTPLYYHNEITKKITRFYEIEQGWYDVTVFLLKSGIVVTFNTHITNDLPFTIGFPKKLAGDVDEYRADASYTRIPAKSVRYVGSDTLLCHSIATLVIPRGIVREYDPFRAYDKGTIVYDLEKTKVPYVTRRAIPESTTPHVLDPAHGWSEIPEDSFLHFAFWLKRVDPTFPRLTPFYTASHITFNDKGYLTRVSFGDPILKSNFDRWLFEERAKGTSVSGFLHLSTMYGEPIISPANGGFVQYFASPKRGEFTVRTLESVSIHRPHHLDLVSQCAECLQPNVAVRCSDAECMRQGKAFCSHECGQVHLFETHS